LLLLRPVRFGGVETRPNGDGQTSWQPQARAHLRPPNERAGRLENRKNAEPFSLFEGRKNDIAAIACQRTPRTAAESATAQKKTMATIGTGTTAGAAGKISAAAIQKVSAVLFIAMAPLSGAMGH